MITKPVAPSALHHYIQMVANEDAIAALKENTRLMFAKLDFLSEDQWTYRYAPEKWSMKQVITHISDTERIFGYRFLRFLRQDATELPGYDENWFADNSRADKRMGKEILQELRVIRSLTQLSFEQAHQLDLDFKGTANGTKITAREIAFGIVGHAQHHLQILDQRYIK